MNLLKFSAAIIISTLLSGCGISKNSLGFNKKSPDEYSLLRQRPLITPPNFDLPEPKEKVGASSITEKEFDNIFYGDKKPVVKANSKKLSKSDKFFLQKTNNHQKKANIKQVITTENAQAPKKAKEKKSLLSKILGK